jgi:MFS transporter, ACS family, D-galactonate transporter
VTATGRPEKSRPGPIDSGAAVKWMAVVLLFVAVLVNYIDRGNLSIAAVPMMKDFGISPASMGTLLSAFFWTYSLMQIPGGYLVDQFDLKWVYAVAFTLWSLASASVGVAQSFRQVLLLRLVLGFAETVAHPASIAFIQRNFRGSEQGLPTSIYLAGMQLGPALGSFVGALLLQQHGWRWLFLITGFGACAWLVPWLALAPTQRNRPPVQAPNKAVLSRVFWRALFANRLVPALLVGAFFYTYYWYFCLTWLPSYLIMARGFSFLRMGTFTAIPLAGMAIVSIIAARVADRIVARRGRALLIRKMFVVCGFSLGSSIVVLPLLGSNAAVLVVLLTSLLGIGIASANYWALTQIIAPQGVIGRVIGCQNTIANAAGICAPLVTGILVNRTGRFDLAIVAAGVSLLVAAASFGFLVREKDAREVHALLSRA